MGKRIMRISKELKDNSVKWGIISVILNVCSISQSLNTLPIVLLDVNQLCFLEHWAFQS